MAFAHLARLSVTNPAPGGGSSDAGAAFTAGPNLPTASYGQTATLLKDGRVLVCGGANGNTVANSAAIYDPTTNQFTAVGPMTSPRFRHTATLLKNGKVLITGGEPSVVISNMITNGQATAELFDPSTGTFSAVANMALARTRHTATLLTNGKVLLVGGGGYAEFWDIQPQVFTELFDPSTNSFSNGPQPVYDRMGHSAVVMKDGTVLILGGINIANTNYDDCLASAELYNPTTNSFTTVGSMLYGRSLPAATLMPDGRVFVAGGMSNTGVVGSVEIYDPTKRAFTLAGQMVPAVWKESAALLADGRILVAGGVDNTYSYSVTEIYDPSKGTFSAVPDMNHQRFLASAVPLASGNVLIIGGSDNGSEGLSSTEIYSSANLATEYLLAVQNPAPDITSTSPSAPVVGQTLAINGTGFNSSTEVWINGNSVQYAESSPSQLSITMPATYGQYSIAVVNPAPGGGQATFNQIAHIGLTAAPSDPGWLPSSTHSLSISATGGGSATFNIREGSNCGTINSIATWNNVPVCGSCSYSTPATSETCHLDFVSTIDPAATATITATISSSAMHATSVSLQSPHDTGAGATLLKNGNVLITGGGIYLGYDLDYVYFDATESASAEVYNAASRTTTAVGSMTTPRAGHTSTLLQNGKVLITGGVLVPPGSDGSQTPPAITSAEVFDPATNTFSAAGSMRHARFYHFAALLPSGDVLIAGGCSGVESKDTTTEIYQVSSGAFKAGPSMVTSHCGGQATMLASGKVLITGSDFNVSGQAVNAADLYDPATGIFTSVGPMVQQRSEHSATLLQDGRVLLVGGYQEVAIIAGWPIFTSAPTATTEYFDPATNSFAAGPDLAFGRMLHAAMQLSNGTIVVAGGFFPNFNPFIGGGVVQRDLEAISPTQSVSGIGLLNGRVQSIAVQLNDGSLFMVGGFFGDPGLTADLVTFGVQVPANPAPSISYGGPNTGSFSGYDIAPGAVILQDGQAQPSGTGVSEAIGYTAPTPYAVHAIQIRNPDGKLSNIIHISE